MRPDFEKLMKEHNVHGMILNNNGIINALEKSYELGKLESEENYNKLKNTFLDLLKELDDTQKQEDWKKEGGII
jgi:hypothetical protein